MDDSQESWYVMADKVEVHSAVAMAALNGQLATKPGVTERSARAIRLRNELNLILELVVKMRERLERELAESDQVQSKFIGKDFIDKVNKLAQSYERLTSSRIALVKAEKAAEDEMTPAQEMEAVRTFVLEGLDNTERAKFLWKLNAAHKKLTGGEWPPKDWPSYE